MGPKSTNSRIQIWLLLKSISIEKHDTEFRNAFYEWKTKYGIEYKDAVLLDEKRDYKAVIMFFDEKAYTMWCLNPIG